MPSNSAKIQVVSSIRVSQSDILALNTTPVVISAASVGFITLFEKATVMYNYKSTPFTNVSNLVSFKLVPTQPDSAGGVIPPPLVVSTIFGGQNILGSSQSVSSTFVAADPYPGKMGALSMSNAALVFIIDGANPTGGDSASSLMISATYSILEQ
jgi:hypothetical protein